MLSSQAQALDTGLTTGQRKTQGDNECQNHIFHQLPGENKHLIKNLIIKKLRKKS